MSDVRPLAEPASPVAITDQAEFEQLSQQLGTGTDWNAEIESDRVVISQDGKTASLSVTDLLNWASGRTPQSGDTVEQQLTNQIQRLKARSAALAQTAAQHTASIRTACHDCKTVLLEHERIGDRCHDCDLANQAWAFEGV